MMGTKARAFAPLCNRSLEDLVPADQFYRHLEAKLDLAFVRELVRSTYYLSQIAGGRPRRSTVSRQAMRLRCASHAPELCASGWLTSTGKLGSALHSVQDPS